MPVARRPRMSQSASARNAGTFGKLVPQVHPAEGEKMTALSSMEYPHWLMIAGVLLLILGFVGLHCANEVLRMNRLPLRVIRGAV